MKMKALVENIDEIREKRGFLPECMQCPLQLTCATRRTPNVLWCPTCKMYWSTVLGSRIDCDALEPRVALDMGACPCTWKGTPCRTDIVRGVQLFDRAKD
jgi:hypothetical protein